MGQQPNIDLGIEDLPRPTAHPGAPRRWSPARPGELGSPEDVPWGGAFGTIGPDAGYALRLVAERDLHPGPGESHHDLERALTALITARASHGGRAPVGEDVEAAEILLGLDRPDDDDVTARRRAAIAGVGHSKARARALVASVDPDNLFATPDELRRRSGPFIGD